MSEGMRRAAWVVGALCAGTLGVRWLREGPWLVAPVLVLLAAPGAALVAWAGRRDLLPAAPGLGLVLLGMLTAALEAAGLPAAAGPAILAASAVAAAAASRPRALSGAVPARESWRRFAAPAVVLGCGVIAGALAPGESHVGVATERSILEPAARALGAVAGVPGGSMGGGLASLLAPVALLLLYAAAERLSGSVAVGSLAVLLGLAHMGVGAGTFTGLAGLRDPCGFTAYLLVPLAILFVVPGDYGTDSPGVVAWTAAGLVLLALCRVQIVSAIPLALGLVALAFAGGSVRVRASGLRALVLLGISALLARAIPSPPEPHTLFPLGGIVLRSIAPGISYVDSFSAVSHLYLAEIDKGWAIGLASVLVLPAVWLAGRPRTAAGPVFLAGVLLGPLLALLTQPLVAPRAYGILAEARACRFFEWCAAAAIAALAAGAMAIVRALGVACRAGRQGPAARPP